MTVGITKEQARRSARWAAFREALPLWVFVLSFAFDYKGDQASGEGSGLQRAFAAIAFAACARYMMFPRVVRPPKPLVLITCAWFVYVLLAFISPARIVSPDGLDLTKSIVAGMPSILLGLGLLVSQTMIARGVQFSSLRIPILLACFISTLMQARYGLVESGVDVERVRYQVLSQGAAFIWGLAILELVPLFKPKLLTFVSLAAAAVSAALSINRNVLISVSAALLLAIVVCFRYRKRISGPQLLNSAKALLLAGVVIFFVVGMTVAIRPNVWTSWTKRISRLGQSSSIGEDTVGIRIAAAEMEFRAISEDPLSLNFGAGFAVEPKLVGPPNRFIFARNVYLKKLGIWDVLWPYPFYVAGLIGGSLGIFVLITGFYRSIKLAFSSIATNSDVLWSNLAPAFMLIVVYATSIAGNTLGGRFACLLIGLSLGNSFPALLNQNKESQE